MCSSGCWLRWGGALVCLALAAGATNAQDMPFSEAETTLMVPDQVAMIYPDGTHGPWMDYVPGNSSTTAVMGVVFDSYEADPNAWNLDTNVPCEVYDRPKGSGNLCGGQCSGTRFRWCGAQGCQVTPTRPSCKNAHGGKMVVDRPNIVQNLNFIWGTEGGEARLETELLFFDTYDGTGCTNPGTNQVAGILLGFDNPAAGFFYTSVNLTTNGLEFAPPTGERIGYQVNFYTNQQNNEVSTKAYPGLWQTKNPDWDDVMGVADTRGYSDSHSNNDCELTNQDTCVGGTGGCPVVGTIRLAGPGMLLLGEMEVVETGCVFLITANSKPKKGCDVCPRRNALYNTGAACEDVKDCPKKLKIAKLDCPDGGPGFCKKVKGKRDSCATP